MPSNQVKLVEEVFTPAQKSQIITKLTGAMVSTRASASNAGKKEIELMIRDAKDGGSRFPRRPK
jgi:phenylpyruvate tautomerase PptA (4-oxalocrotonate tautomerase family)